MRFGISTHLYHDRRLEREHLAQVAGHGFETIELFATRSHFDYRDDARDRPSSAQWLGETGLTLNSVHAPITDVFGGRRAAAGLLERGRRRRPARGGRARDRSRAAASRGGFRSTSWCCTSARPRRMQQRATTIAAPRRVRSLEEICRAGRAARRPGRASR